jgi:hypothetical protein
MMAAVVMSVALKILEQDVVKHCPVDSRSATNHN